MSGEQLPAEMPELGPDDRIILASGERMGLDPQTGKAGLIDHEMLTGVLDMAGRVSEADWLDALHKQYPQPEQPTGEFRIPYVRSEARPRSRPRSGGGESPGANRSTRATAAGRAVGRILLTERDEREGAAIDHSAYRYVPLEVMSRDGLAELPGASEYQRFGRMLVRFKHGGEDALEPEEATLLERIGTFMAPDRVAWAALDPAAFDIRSAVPGASARSNLLQTRRANTELMTLAAALDSDDVDYLALQAVFPTSRSPLVLAAYLGLPIGKEDSLVSIRQVVKDEVFTLQGAETLTEREAGILLRRFAVTAERSMEVSETALALGTNSSAVSITERSAIDKLLATVTARRTDSTEI